MITTTQNRIHEASSWPGEFSKTSSERIPLTEQEEIKLISYFQNRSAMLKVSATTITPLAQILDWIRPETQCGGSLVASPPPPLLRSAVIQENEEADFIQFELESPEAERGPQGTIPVLRRGLTDLRFVKILEQILVQQSRQTRAFWLDKNHLTQLSENKNVLIQDFILHNPQIGGGQALIYTSDPDIQPDGFEVGKICMLSKDKVDFQSLEAGLIEHPGENGGRVAHLFTNYCTRGDRRIGDNIGGYNQGVAGWVQVSNSIYPGCLSKPIHFHPHTRYIAHFQYQLFHGNWWLAVNCNWIGYYPASLFKNNGTNLARIIYMENL